MLALDEIIKKYGRIELGIDIVTLGVINYLAYEPQYVRFRTNIIANRIFSSLSHLDCLIRDAQRDSLPIKIWVGDEVVFNSHEVPTC